MHKKTSEILQILCTKSFEEMNIIYTCTGAHILLEGARTVLVT